MSLFLERVSKIIQNILETSFNEFIRNRKKNLQKNVGIVSGPFFFNWKMKMNREKNELEIIFGN